MHPVIAALVFSQVLPVAHMTQECRAAANCFDAAMKASVAGVTIGYGRNCGVDTDRLVSLTGAVARHYAAGQSGANARLIRAFTDDGWEEGMHINRPAGLSCQQVMWALIGLESETGSR